MSLCADKTDRCSTYRALDCTWDKLLALSWAGGVMWGLADPWRGMMRTMLHQQCPWVDRVLRAPRAGAKLAVEMDGFIYSPTPSSRSETVTERPTLEMGL